MHNNSDKFDHSNLGYVVRVKQDILTQHLLKLNKQLDADFLFIAETNVDYSVARTLITLSKQSVIDNFSYPLPFSPCERVFDANLCIFPKGVAQDFPKDIALTEMGINGYMGIPIVSEDSKPVGILVALFKKELTETSSFEYFLEVFAELLSTLLQTVFLNEQMRQQQKTIQTMQRLDIIGKMAAGVAHDFNNLLGILGGNLDLLSINQPFLKEDNYFLKAMTALERAKATTTKLAKASKLPTSNKDLGSISEIVREVNDILSDTLPSNIQLHLRFEENITQLVNKSDFHDCLINLIMNAKNAIHHFGQINISVYRTKIFNEHSYHEFFFPSQADSYIAVCVSDTGEGIKEHLLDKIFLPFQSYSNIEGSGLGLAMVAGFVSRENYGLTINTQVGEGTSFCLYIPELSQNQPHSNNPKHQAPAPCKAKKIVLVEDEVELIEIMKRFLEIDEHQVNSFSNGQMAMAYLNNCETYPDAIITDQTMPGKIQGIDLYNKFKSKTRVIIVTGDSSQIQTLLPSSNLLQKPITIDLLRQALLSD